VLAAVVGGYAGFIAWQSRRHLQDVKD
jgi:hypothetical protein